MRQRVINRVVLSAFVITGLTLACDQPATNIPTMPPGPSLNTFDLIGPSSIEPGQSVQMSAVVHFPDGTVKPAVSPTVIWRTSNPAILQLDQSGLVRSLTSTGESTITAQIGARSISREVVVLPAGTFRLVGTVSETGVSGFGIPGARVEVASGSPSTAADAGGLYRLYGVPPTADIHVSAGGYNDQTFPVQLTSNSTRNFTLNLSGPRPNLAGNYTLFIDAQSCTGSPPFPSEFQHRSYLATLTQGNGGGVSVLLTEPRFNLKQIPGFTPKGNTFSGSVFGNGAAFFLSPYGAYTYLSYISYPDVVERLPDGRNLVVAGDVNASGSSAGLSGTMTSSSLALYDSRFPAPAAPLGVCSSALQFRLEPR